VKHTVVLLSLLPALALASTGVAFLKIPVGPRICATGEAAAAYVDDASALYYNPAGLANASTHSALLAHNQGFLDMDQEYVTEVSGSEGRANSAWANVPLTYQTKGS
jgi:long-subunit fatty acid transport protein